MSIFYLLQENGDKIQLENLSGFIILDSSVAGPTVDWQAGGRGRPFKRTKREELFDSIEHALRVALGIAEEVTDLPSRSERAVSHEPLWSEQRLHDALADYQSYRSRAVEHDARIRRLDALIRAYEDEQKRQEALRIDDEETWFLMS